MPIISSLFFWIMKVAIIGARKNRNGIGEFIGKYFHKNGATVVSVLGTDEETSRDASIALMKYGIKPNYYTDFNQMIENEKPDTAVIATPSSSHYEYLKKCINRGLNVFCEKPFIWNQRGETKKIVEDIFKRAINDKLIVAMNSQWPFAMNCYQEICGTIAPKDCHKFFISMSPISFGSGMIPESVPHALSILYFFLKEGSVLNLDFDTNERKKTLIIHFKYLSKVVECKVLIELIEAKGQPRNFQFGFNEKIVVRSLNLENYDIYFNYLNRRLKIADPLELSVKNFIFAVKEKVEPLIGYHHILNNMYLLEKIYNKYNRL